MEKIINYDFIVATIRSTEVTTADIASRMKSMHQFLPNKKTLSKRVRNKIITIRIRSIYCGILPIFISPNKSNLKTTKRIFMNGFNYINNPIY